MHRFKIITLSYVLYLSLFFISTSALASPFLDQLELLENNPHDFSAHMPIFIESWDSYLLELKDLATTEENHDVVYQSVSLAISDILSSHFNLAGLQFLQSRCHLQSRLMLATSYFHGFALFNEPNTPSHAFDILYRSALLYKDAVIEIKVQQKSCLQEFDHAVLENKEVKHLRFAYLPSTRSTKLIRVMNNFVACVDPKQESTLGALPSRALNALRTLVEFTTDVMTPAQKQNAAYCAFFILNDKPLACKLYAYEKRVSIARAIDNFPNLDEWLRQAQPFLQLKKMDT